MMRYALPVTENLVPQWKLCYYNYPRVYDIVDIFEKLSTIHSNIRRKQLHTYMRTNSLGPRRLSAERDVLNLIKKISISNCNILFFRYVELEVIFLFASYKMSELKHKFKLYKIITAPFAIGDDDCLTLIENVYIELVYLQKLVQHSLNLDNKIVTVIDETAERFQQIKKQYPQKKVQRILKCIKSDANQVQKYYLDKKFENPNYQDKKRLKLLPKQDEKIQKGASIVYGGVVGLMLFFVGVFFILASKFKFQQNPVFMAYVPAWRGLIPFLVYLYVLGIDIFIFQRKKINYKRIIQVGQVNIPDASNIILTASIISILYLILLILFGLSTAKQIQFDKPEGLVLWAYIFWLVLLFFPFTCHKVTHLLFPGRQFIQSILMKMFASCFIKVDYCSNWLSEQLTSFKLAFQDLCNAILIFLYGIRSSNADTALFLGAIIGSCMFTVRIFQASNRIIREKACGFQKPYIFGIIKCLLGIATIWTSYAARLVIKNHGDEEYWIQKQFIIWIIVATISSLWAYGFDLLFDWDYISKKPGCNQWPFYTRKTKIYHNYTYIIIAVINFILRIAWALTISTDLTQRIFGQNSYILITVFSALEICRRGLWNLIFIEKDHVKSVLAFEAIVNNSDLQEKVLNRYKNFVSDEEVIQINKYMEKYKQSQKDLEFQKSRVKEKIKSSEANDQQAAKYINEIQKNFVEELQKKYKMAMKDK